jgi:hypothetical protein
MLLLVICCMATLCAGKSFTKQSLEESYNVVQTQTSELVAEIEKLTNQTKLVQPSFFRPNTTVILNALVSAQSEAIKKVSQIETQIESLK